MVRPLHFTYNEQTAVNNSFQKASKEHHLSRKAVEEFDRLVTALTAHGMEVTVIEDTPAPHTPDAVFPNNWISFHDGGIVCLYPMFAENRRAERKPAVTGIIRKKFLINQLIDFTAYEAQGLFLEGTGSMVLDRENRIAYACLSPRTEETVLRDFCHRLAYQPVCFRAADAQRRPVYHTNVLMCVADRYAVLCTGSVTDAAERERLTAVITHSGKVLIEISLEQMNHFAGNMLQVANQQGEKFLVMSSQAFHSLTPQQVQVLQQFNPIIHTDLTHIETNGGGSARCMIAEIFLPPLPCV